MLVIFRGKSKFKKKLIKKSPRQNKAVYVIAAILRWI